MPYTLVLVPFDCAQQAKTTAANEPKYLPTLSLHPRVVVREWCAGQVHSSMNSWSPAWPGCLIAQHSYQLFLASLSSIYASCHF
jgi:hypothetical protein